MLNLIQMPIVDVVVDMEDTGVAFDMDYNAELKEKYHKLLDEKEAKFHSICEMYADEIANYRGETRLDDPINIQSVPQLQALLFDIAKIEAPIDKKTKKPSRSTSEENLKKLKNPLADAILEYREFSTIVSTFIDKLPECVNPKDGRVHCKFNQYGADTGRFSSQDPNMQNIPSSNHDIRKMFVAQGESFNVEFDTDAYLEVNQYDEIFTNNIWIKVENLKIGDTLDLEGDIFTISKVENLDGKIRIYL
jgi:DNA polymerase-1